MCAGICAEKYEMKCTTVLEKAKYFFFFSRQFSVFNLLSAVAIKVWWEGYSILDFNRGSSQEL